MSRKRSSKQRHSLTSFLPANNPPRPPDPLPSLAAARRREKWFAKPIVGATHPIHFEGWSFSKAVSILEAAERGDFAELQLVLRKLEKRFPVLKALKVRRLSAMEKLDRDIKTSSNLPPGYTQSDAEKQQKFLRSRYELIANLRDAIGVLTMAEFRGYSILQKRRFHGGANDGGLQEFYWLPQSNFQRDGAHGDWFYNADSSFGATPERLSEKNRIGSEELPREDFVI